MGSHSGNCFNNIISDILTLNLASNETSNNAATREN